MHRKRDSYEKTITILTDYLGLGKIDMKIGDVIIIGILIISSFIPLFIFLLRREPRNY